MQRCTLAAGAAGILVAGVLALPATATAQGEDYERIVTIMRACAQIEELTARVMCYDNNIGSAMTGNADRAGNDRIAAPAPTVGPAPSGSPVVAAPVSAPQPTGFGSEMVPQTRRAQQAAQQDEFSARVGAVRELEPGIYLLTLSDGAQWRFVESAPMSFDPPRAGSTIELERGSLGSVFLSYAGQRRLRVRRVQ